MGNKCFSATHSGGKNPSTGDLETKRSNLMIKTIFMGALDSGKNTLVKQTFPDKSYNTIKLQKNDVYIYPEEIHHDLNTVTGG